MRFDFKSLFVTAVCVISFSLLTFPLQAQRRGGGGGGGGGGRSGGVGGARPSMGHVGGGGGRPSMGAAGGGARPNVARPSPSRPTPKPGGSNRPSFGNVARPSGPATRPNVPTTRPSTRPSTPGLPTRPGLPTKPGSGGFHPGGGGRPGVSLPGGKPGGGIPNRPSVKPPTNLKPPTRPSLPGNAGGNRPTTLPGNIGSNRPTLPGNKLPGIGGNQPGLPNLGGGNRPTTLPGNIGNRPGNNRPSFGNIDRPATLPGIGGGNRPGSGGNGNRPVIGGGGNRVNIGNGGRTNIGNRINNGNINVGNTVNIGNRGGNFVNTRPAWDRGYHNAGWGLGGSWAGNWHNHCINGQHGWYNGCWNRGYWGSNWYRPVAWASVGWGLGRWTSGWGYGASYYNPYYVVPTTVVSAPYDYSQPVVVNNYVSADATSGDSTVATAQPPQESEQALSSFDQGLAEFKSGSYQQALATLDQSLKELPNDPVVHEVRALTLFALGQYSPAAASLNSLLSSAPGMDWTTMSSLYGNVDDYSAQLQKLEAYCQSNPTDSAAWFVLAYHYLVVDSKDNAMQALQVVVQNEPKDATAKRMLDALVPPAPDATTPTTDPAQSTDLAGKWRATVGTTTIDLEITDISSFVWKTTESGQPPVELTGQLTADNDAIVLSNEAQGSMAGVVKSLGPDKWKFLLDGAPTSDPGISFVRTGN